MGGSRGDDWAEAGVLGELNSCGIASNVRFSETCSYAMLLTELSNGSRACKDHDRLPLVFTLSTFYPWRSEARCS